MKQIYEVRNDYTNNNYTHIDIYESDDENSPGKTVAIVCQDTGKVFFLDNLYNLDEKVKTAIKEVLSNNPKKQYAEETYDALKAMYREFWSYKNMMSNDGQIAALNLAKAVLSKVNLHKERVNKSINNFKVKIMNTNEVKYYEIYTNDGVDGFSVFIDSTSGDPIRDAEERALIDERNHVKSVTEITKAEYKKNN